MEAQTCESVKIGCRFLVAECVKKIFGVTISSAPMPSAFHNHNNKHLDRQSAVGFPSRWFVFIFFWLGTCVFCCIWGSDTPAEDVAVVIARQAESLRNWMKIKWLCSDLCSEL